ncbi:Zn-ribbon domain-containing OB-fold protein [Cupriavidus pinatubonensis]|uniref:DUF35 domain-containing protein n=1 Tax=Cupriavidus pinatubonensis TaxID=248026 RepID=A0ABM8Y2C8_9BURK|nr:OB-fold domain-containing protein [Cupriavidus pinatubonensis]CAG9186910.1 hypothetical protein LMG23994_06441 [Cupriavidus pinatubonensis]
MIQTKDGWPQPYALLDAQPYWEGLAAGQLKYQRCTACGEAVWPAHSFCPHCEADEGDGLVWQQAKGTGTLYSFSTVMRGPTPAFASIAPYTVGFVEMDEGYHLFAQIEGAPETLHIGARMTARLIERGGQRLPVFAAA